MLERSGPETCPGIKNFIRPKLEFIVCPNCASNVEIWSDEDTAVCDICGKEVHRLEKNASCLDWCEFADKCRAIIESKKQ
ncbi:MAG: phosphohydrolase [Candidatus Bathyarchaeia archaeon]